MAITNHERVGKALEFVRDGLQPFVERELQKYAKRWFMGRTALRTRTQSWWQKPNAEWDVAVPARRDVEQDLERRIRERPLARLSELRERTARRRNRWAHQEPFSGDDAYRALDSAARLLTAISAPQSDEIEKVKMELLRVRFDEQARGEKRKSAGAASKASRRELSSPGAKWSPRTRTWRAAAISRRSSPPTCGKCTWAKDRTNTRSRRSSSAAPFSPRA